jgi:putative transposase
LDEADKKARLERARETGLFRYSLVQELAEPGIGPAERGRRARGLAGRVHDGPGGQAVTVSVQTLGRWRRLYQSGGFDALVPSPRQCQPRTPAEVLDLAEALKREKPDRTAAQVRRILGLTAGWAPSDRTLQRLFERLELNAPAREEEEQRAFGRFECTRPNEMWTGDTLHGPAIGGSKSYLFAFLDDHSRAVMGARWAYHDDVVRMAAAFRPALQRRRCPGGDLPGQRLGVRRRVAAARLRGPGHQADPLPAGKAGGKREDRALLPHGAGSVPGRDR